jgi:hypothetical protein
MSGAPRRVFLHVGTPKSGTTYVQDLLWRNRIALRAAGVLYPGDRPDAQFLATLDLLDRPFHGQVDPAQAGAWDRIAAEVRAWRGTSVISHELLAPAAPDIARRARDSFGATEVHILCTARDLARQVPAVWQEDIKNRGALTFAEFSRSLRGVDDSADPYFARTFWGFQDLPAVLRVWGETLPPERVHVVPIPRGAPPDTLWRRLAGVLGVSPGACPDEGATRNTSAGVAEINLVRLLNESGLVADFDWPSYESLVKEFLTGDVLATRPGATPLRLPAEDRHWVEQRSKQFADSLRAAGYHVAGDLDELLPAHATGSGTPHPDQPGDDELLAASVYALAATLRLVARERAQPSAGRARTVRGAILERYGRNPVLRLLLRPYRRARTALRRSRAR